jgi:hypothetical protein
VERIESANLIVPSFVGVLNPGYLRRITHHSSQPFVGGEPKEELLAHRETAKDMSEERTR